MSRTEILRKIGGRDFDALVDPAFLRRFGLSRPGQYGVVCADVSASIDMLEGLGATPFIHATTAAPGWTERGEKKPVQVEMAMGYTDGEQIELLGPGENTDFYREAVPTDGSMALHHVCCMQDNLADLRRRLAAGGFPLVVEGGVNIGLLSTHFAYFDTRDELGVWLEIAEYRLLGRHRPPSEAFITRLAKLQRRLR